MIARIHSDTGDLTEDELRWQLGPRRIHLEAWRGGGVLRGLLQRRGDSLQNHESGDDHQGGAEEFHAAPVYGRVQ